jgi:poly(ADP-ribose) glycohydrolase ARH3
MPPKITLRDRFRGALLGLAVGDAFGARFEGHDPEWIAYHFATPADLFAAAPDSALMYTDDTQMMIGVAETLIEHGTIVEDALCHAFVMNYDPRRGYGMGARRVIEAMMSGVDHRRVAETHFPGGSFGNGAAMRVAPVGLAYHDDPDRVWDEAGRSAGPTHTHPLGVEGAQVLALAVALCVRGVGWPEIFEELAARCHTEPFRHAIRRAASSSDASEAGILGNEITAQRSVPTALALAATNPDDYALTIGRAVHLGGDTDTIAAMAGALAGASLGVGAIPATLLGRLEDGRKGRSYIERLADSLHDNHASRQGA